MKYADRPLYEACLVGHLEMFVKLVESGSEPNIHDTDADPHRFLSLSSKVIKMWLKNSLN